MASLDTRASRFGGIYMIFELVLLSVLVASCHAVENGLVIVRADQKIDLQSQLVRIASSFKVENGGARPVDSVSLAVAVPPPSRLAFSTAILLGGKAKSRSYEQLTLTQIPTDTSSSSSSSSNVTLFSAALPKPLAPGKTLQLEAYFVLMNALVAHPAAITQADPQLMVYEGSHYLLSPYPVRTQSTIVKLPSQQVESFTAKEPSRKSDSEIRFGPFDDVAPMSVSLLTVHYENNRPFGVFVRAERELEISHWGNVYVTEDYSLEHTGAKHKGMFSRLDYVSRPMAVGVSSVRTLLAVLPARANSVYYRDEIGNISTSHLRYQSNKAELEIEPRYPLLGGWSVTFRVGYSVPLADLVSIAADGTRLLNASFGSAFMDVPIEHLTIKVVLPEGSYAIASDVPFDVEKSFETKFSYLDTVGRPVVVMDKRDVAPEAGSMHFQVRYRFSSVALLTEPLLLVGAFFLLFVLFIVYIRSDVTISKTSTAYLAKMSHEELVDVVQRVQCVVSTRSSLVDRLDASLVQLGRSGNATSAKATRKATEAELRETASEVAALLGRLEAIPKPPAQLRTVQSLILKDKERADRSLSKHTVAVEAFEKQVPAREMDGRLAPMQQRLAALKAEIKELCIALEE